MKVQLSLTILRDAFQDIVIAENIFYAYAVLRNRDYDVDRAIPFYL